MSAVDFMRPGTATDRVDGEVPPQVAEPDTPRGFADTLKQASAERLPTVIRGGGTKLTWGRPPDAVDLVVSTSRLNGLIAHRHGDLTATVQAGMRLRDLNAALSVERQWLPIDSAFDAATVGEIDRLAGLQPAKQRTFGYPERLSSPDIEATRLRPFLHPIPDIEDPVVQLERGHVELLGFIYD